MYKNIEGYSDPTMGAVMRIMMTEYNAEKCKVYQRQQEIRTADLIFICYLLPCA